MCQTQREDEKMVGEEEITIAEAIYAGLSRIAEAIEYHGRVTAGSDDVEEPTARYMDGTPNIDGTPMR